MSLVMEEMKLLFRLQLQSILHIWEGTGAFVTALSLIGLIFMVVKISTFVRLLASLYFLPGKSLPDFGRVGSWALVTGASDGIGKEFALQLARSGFNIFLVSRTASKMEILAKEIETLQMYSGSKRSAKILVMDFAAGSDSDYTRLQSLISGLDIAILINNVGKSHDIPVPFAQTPYSEMKEIIAINCMGTLRVTSLVLPGMISRKRGLILTMGSFGGLLPTPLLATYSGSKAFLQQWSSALGAEVAPYNITVELVQSYLVTSAMSKIRRPTATIPAPKQFVEAVLDRVGRSGGAQGWAYTSTPYWSHAFMQWALGLSMGFTSSLVVSQNKAIHEAIRKRALAKQERESGKKAL
ncbi:hypothetical protein MMC34_007966 [Xylographa carneopallida]|nr:hypothetical protein [Xylographa carneopallida]